MSELQEQRILLGLRNPDPTLSLAAADGAGVAVGGDPFDSLELAGRQKLEYALPIIRRPICQLQGGGVLELTGCQWLACCVSAQPRWRHCVAQSESVVETPQAREAARESNVGDRKLRFRQQLLGQEQPACQEQLHR